MAASAEASNILKASGSQSNSWNPAMSVQQLEHVMAVYYSLGYYLDPAAAYNLTFAEQPRAKRRKIEASPAEVQASNEPIMASITNTRLNRSSRGVTFKPYSDIRLDNPNLRHCTSLHGTRGERPLQGLKRRFDERGSGGHGVKSVDFANNLQNVVKGQKAHGNRSTIGNLFPEILSMIFEYLDVQSKGRAAQVCSRWRDAAYKKSVWKDLTAGLHLNRSNPTLFSSLSQRGLKHVQVLSLSRSPKDVFNGIPAIQSVNLSGCYNLSDQNLEKAFVKKVPTLTSLNLSLCKEVSDSSLGRIATFCENLKSLDLAGCTRVTNSGLMMIAWGLKQLKHLNLRSCRQISDQGIGSLCGLENNYSAASSSLQSLSLQDCQKLTDESLRYIAQGLPQLKSINLSFCVSITDTGLKSLAKMALLDDINLRSCDNVSDIGIGFLAEDHGRIQSLDISFCGNVTDASLRHLSSSQTLGGTLRKLSLTTCAITDEGLVKVAKNLKSLHELHMGQCVKLSDLSIEAIAENMKDLTFIDLYGCHDLSSKVLDKLKRQLPKLNKLNLSL